MKLSIALRRSFRKPRFLGTKTPSSERRFGRVVSELPMTQELSVECLLRMSAKPTNEMVRRLIHLL